MSDRIRLRPRSWAMLAAAAALVAFNAACTSPAPPVGAAAAPAAPA